MGLRLGLSAVLESLRKVTQWQREDGERGDGLGGERGSVRSGAVRVRGSLSSIFGRNDAAAGRIGDGGRFAEAIRGREGGMLGLGLSIGDLCGATGHGCVLWIGSERTSGWRVKFGNWI